MDTNSSLDVALLDNMERNSDTLNSGQQTIDQLSYSVGYSADDAAYNDPLPAVEDLAVSGEAYPGREIQACGYSINGTTCCNFKWLRILENGSVEYIDGANEPVYLVTADDVENYLAIEVQPIDDRKRKGELVRVFANDHRKITCEPSMISHIKQNLDSGIASYKVSLSTGDSDVWEPATLTIKPTGYCIDGSESGCAAIRGKILPETTVIIAHGHTQEFSICSPDGSVDRLRAEDTLQDIASERDAIVLTLRRFIRKAKLVPTDRYSKLKRIHCAFFNCCN